MQARGGGREGGVDGVCARGARGVRGGRASRSAAACLRSTSGSTATMEAASISEIEPPTASVVLARARPAPDAARSEARRPGGPSLRRHGGWEAWGGAAR